MSTSQREIDSKDRQILRILAGNALTSKAEIARQLGVTPTAVFERIRKLEERGIISGYELRIAPHSVGLDLLAFVFVTEAKPVQGMRPTAKLAAIPGVEEVHKIAGEDCYLVKIRARNTADLGRVLDEEIASIDNVGRVRTTIVLDTVLEGRQAALAGLLAAD